MSSKERIARIVRVRALMLKDQPFFGLLASRLKLVEDPHCKTLWTDSKTLGFNPGFVDSLLDLQLKGYIAKGVLHIAAGHPWRKGKRDSKVWNKACTQAVVSLLNDANMYVDPALEFREEFEGKAAEAIYVQLFNEEPPSNPPPESDKGSPDENSEETGPGAPGAGESSKEDPSGTEGSGNSDAPGGESDSDDNAPVMEVREGDPTTAEDDRREWAMAMSTATRMQGNLPGNIKELVAGILPPTVDWRDELRTFFERAAGTPDYSWSRPNSRYTHLGTYMPSLQSEGISCLVFVRDTSGSVSPDYARAMNSELVDIVETLKPEIVYVLDVDTRIHKVQELTQGCTAEDLDYVLDGRGGTSFVEPFKWLEDNGISCAALVYATDLEGKFPATEPDCPTLWLVPEGNLRRKTPPFGEVIEMTLC